MKKNLTALIVGNWFIGGMSPEEEGILVVTPEGRVVQFPTSATRPRMNQTMRLWSSEDTDGHVRFRPSPSAKGWVRRVEVSGGSWTMIAVQDGSECSFPCRHASRVFLPPWFDELLARNLSLMAERESQDEAEQVAAPNPSSAPNLKPTSSVRGSEG